MIRMSLGRAGPGNPWERLQKFFDGSAPARSELPNGELRQAAATGCYWRLLLVPTGDVGYVVREQGLEDAARGGPGFPTAARRVEGR
jgi:hypothetical protein